MYICGVRYILIVENVYCRSGNIREVLISRGGLIREFKNLAKNNFISATYHRYRYFGNSRLREKSQNHKFARI